MASVAFKNVPQTAATTFAFSSVQFFLYGPTVPSGWESDPTVCTAHAPPYHHWSVIWARDPEEKHVAVSKLHHEIRVFGRLSFISVEVEAKQIGPGLVYLTFTSPLFGRCILFESVTPVEPMVQRVLHRLYAPLMMKGPFGNLIVWGEAIMVCLMSYILFPF